MDHGDKIQCSNCKCWREPDSYQGKRGIVKRCLKCREKDTKQKQKPEVREKRNQRQSEKKYYIAYRENKRKENEEEFLKHNAEIMKQWRKNNSQHLSEWKTKNFGSRIWAIKQQATRKGITWDDNMTDIICKDLMSKACFYCNVITDTTLNGIDRMDSMSNYTVTNCVSCCKTCNFMKTCLDVNTFIKRCKHISKLHFDEGILYPSIWKDTTYKVSYINYKKRAERKNLAFLLTLEDFNKIKEKPCYYCGKENTKSHSNGIDRNNNDLGYTIDNCVSCCGECNYMKGMLLGEEFLEKCKSISKHHNIFVDIPAIPEHKEASKRKQSSECI